MKKTLALTVFFCTLWHYLCGQNQERKQGFERLKKNLVVSKLKHCKTLLPACKTGPAIAVDPSIGKIEAIPQDIGRVLLNLINNAFCAVYERANRLGIWKQKQLSACRICHVAQV